jgi:hypothetical protein
MQLCLKCSYINKCFIQRKYKIYVISLFSDTIVCLLWEAQAADVVGLYNGG